MTERATFLKLPDLSSDVTRNQLTPQGFVIHYGRGNVVLGITLGPSTRRSRAPRRAPARA